MLDEKKILTDGINALSRAHTLNYFVDGHRGGAIISGVYLCQENSVEAGVPKAIGKILEERWVNSALCAAFPQENVDPTLLQKILYSLEQSASVLREAGHNVILPTLALKAFRMVPGAVTPARVAGICRMIEAFKVTKVPPSKAASLPDLEDRTAFANFALREFVQCTQRFSGRGQGWSGHLLTYSRAMLDLVELGYADTARQALPGYRLYIQRIRSGPQETDKPRSEKTPTDIFPLQSAYWSQREGDLNLGHQIKYPYGFYGLFNWADDKTIQHESLQAVSRVF